jgi:hypothetical protein
LFFILDFLIKISYISKSLFSKMEKGKRQRIPSAQQVERWARAVVAVVHREAMEVESNDAVLALVSPTTDQWDYFLGLIDDLESSKVNLGTEIASDTVNATVRAVAHASLDSIPACQCEWICTSKEHGYYSKASYCEHCKTSKKRFV